MKFLIMQFSPFSRFTIVMLVDPYHQGIARPPYKEGSCEYIEQAVTYSRKGVVI
jgi:hypothetical protein